MAKRTYYQVLGVEVSATQEQVRRAYRALARSLHPDVSKAPDAQARFAELAEAYEVLSDRRRRAEYDLSLAAPPPAARRRSPGQPPAAHYTWSNIATDATAAEEQRASDFDEMYETYFTPHKPAE